MSEWSTSHSTGRMPARHGLVWKTWQVLKVVQARLRFIAILAVIGATIAYWETLSNYWEKTERWLWPDSETQAVSPDIEYFCPMHPYIIRDNPRDKCPICHMDLARRKKGADESEPLPPGTVNRVQLTPYREVLAGVQTTEVAYRPLVREITTFGTVEFNETKQDHIAATQKARIEKLYVNFTGQMVEKGEKLALLDVRYSPELTVTLEDLVKAQRTGNRELERMARQRLRLWDLSDEQVEEFLRTGKVDTHLTIYSRIHGHVIKKYQREGNFVEEGTPLYDVADLDTVWIEAQVYEADQGLLHEGLRATATTLSLPNQTFTGTLTFIYPHLDESTRTLTVRFEVPNIGHELKPGMYTTVKLQLAADQVAAVQAVSQQGGVLAVPESAVIDTGSLKLVYREAEPHVFDGVRVELGPRMVEPGSTVVFYPVLSGLHAGDRVAGSGAFLLDAETRLNPAAGSIYFGGSGGKTTEKPVAVRPSTPDDADVREKKIKATLAKLPAEDRALAAVQKFCPIQEEQRLGDTMGVPVKVMLKGQPVFLCCKSCVKQATKDPDGTLAKVKELKAKAGSPEGSARP
jgi:Cu(I)/Ag(I) efflux system membrane fusion protein